MAAKDQYHVQMFGKFTITHGKECIDVSECLGKQLVNLLQLLFYSYRKIVTKDLIIEVLYPDHEDPTSAIKFSVFRLRKELQNIPMFKDKEVVVTKKHGYQINPELEYTLDLEMFENYWQGLKDIDDLVPKEVKVAKKMIALYEGRMYMTNSILLWFSNLCEYYRSVYAKCVMKVCKALLKEQKYDEMMQLNYKAILLEPFYEGLHYYYMRGLIETKDYHNALKYYDDLNESFYRELGTGLSPRFKELYDVIVKDSEEEDSHVDTKELLDALFGKQQEAGCYYCTFDLFKYLFEISMRSAARDRKKYYLILFEITSHAKQSDIPSIMNKLKNVITISLRSNDVFAKVNQKQFVILLSCTKEDDTYLVINRITSTFYRRVSQKDYRINYHMIPVSGK